MELTLIIIFITSLLCLLQSYIFYPLSLHWMARKLEPKKVFKVYQPDVSVIMAVYNEEAVILEKLESLFASDYPREKIKVYIGSDCSGDRSADIINGFAKGKDNIFFYDFKTRRGKIQVINELGGIVANDSPMSEDHILMYTDANVILEPMTLSNLVRHFGDPEIAVVDANMLNRKLKKEGISMAERAYLDTEVYIKHLEGQLWGMMQGAFGGCYCLRSTHYTEVPSNYIVDDFYITFGALVNGGKAINDLEARCYESANHDIKEEFKRKVRISSGNFQNLFYFLPKIFGKGWRLPYTFISHKVCRWLGPIMMIAMLISSFILAWWGNTLFTLAFLGLMFLILVLPMLDIILLRLGIQIGIFRKIRYFMVMNLALLKGLFKYGKGIQHSIWEPPKRT